MSPISLLQALPLLCAVFAYLRWRTQRSPFPLPPGPAKLPLLGNLFNFPSGGFDWEVYAEWGKKYNSEVVHVGVPGTSIVILNSVKATQDLLVKRSALYSGRPKFTFVREFLGFSWLIPFMPYGAVWKEQRRYFQRHVQANQELASGQVSELATEFARRMLLDLLDTPEDYLTHIHQAVCCTLQSTAYGFFATKEDNVSYLTVAGEVMEALSDATIPIATLLDSVPWILPFLPRSLLPPAFSKGSEYWKGLHYRFRDEPFLKAEKSHNDSFVSRCLADLQPLQDPASQRDHIKNAATTFFIGGSATTIALMHTFILTMLAFPECQKKAQEELDSIVGQERLPDLSDAPSLPYLSALIKEVHRWKTVGPIGIPHYLAADDVYEGYLIPGKSIVIGNAWAMLHDEVEYPDPKAFKPERFLENGKINPAIRDPTSIVFGFGRRVCPGAQIAQVISWMQIATLLSNFNISPAIDDDGNIQVPTMEYHNGVTLQPVPFKCNITARHENIRKLLQEDRQD